MYSSKNDNNLASEMKKLAPDQSLCFGTHFDDRSKMLLCLALPTKNLSQSNTE